MKPTKNKIFCLACQRPKMLFKSKSKADNFIKFNAEAIFEETGVAPVRSYFCMFCGGWHVTSNPSMEEGENMNARDRRKFNRLTYVSQRKETVKKLRAQITERLVAARVAIRENALFKAERIISGCIKSVDAIRKISGSAQQANLAQNEVQQVRDRFAECKLGFDFYTQKLNGLMKRYSSDENALSAICSILDVVQNRHLIITNLDTEMVKEVNEICRTKVSSLPKTKYKELRTVLNKALDAIARERKNYISSLKPAAVQPCTDKAVVKEYYREFLLGVINKVEQIEAFYNAGDLDACVCLISEANDLLELSGFADSNTELVAAEISKWASLLAANARIIA